MNMRCILIVFTLGIMVQCGEGKLQSIAELIQIHLNDFFKGCGPRGLPKDRLKQYDKIHAEKMAFKFCEKNGKQGLTWSEVENCEVHELID